MQWVITDEEDGVLLRTFLHRIPGLSRRLLTRLKQDPCGISVNGQHVTVRAVLHKGETLTLRTEDILPAQERSALPIPILYEDADVLLVSKPGDMPTHPSHGHRGDTLADLFDSADGLTVFRPVNRLDRETSGIVLLAKNQLSAARLSQAMQAGCIRKQYIALLDGHLPARTGTVDLPIRREADSIITRVPCSLTETGAMEAHTRYHVIAQTGTHTLVCAMPLTGRTHQLRVHFAALGTPIHGDGLYGTPSSRIPRQALHAAALTFPHPTTQREMTVLAPLPADMRALLSLLFFTSASD